MKDYITVASFHNIYQLGLVKSQLQTEGIIFMVQDEHTLQMANIYSYAIGGAKLQVLTEDVGRVREILLEFEVLSADHDTKADYGVLEPLSQLAGKLPFLRPFPPALRVFFVFSVLGMIVFLVLIFLFGHE